MSKSLQKFSQIFSCRPIEFRKKGFSKHLPKGTIPQNPLPKSQHTPFLHVLWCWKCRWCLDLPPHKQVSKSQFPQQQHYYPPYSSFFAFILQQSSTKCQTNFINIWKNLYLCKILHIPLIFNNYLNLFWKKYFFC